MNDRFLGLNANQWFAYSVVFALLNALIVYANGGAHEVPLNATAAVFCAGAAWYWAWEGDDEP